MTKSKTEKYREMTDVHEKQLVRMGIRLDKLADRIFTIEFLAENREKRWRWWKIWQR
jgi:hypothetical protein